MKKNIKFIYSLIIVIGIIIIGSGIYYVVANNQNRDDQNEMKEKVLSEIKYVEQKLVVLFNKMNQIEYENYKISTESIEDSQNSSEDTSGQTSNQSSQNTSNTESGQNSDSNSQSEQEGNSSQSSDNSQGNNNLNNQNGNQKENNQKYTLQAAGVLTEERSIDWDSVKIEVENLYTSLPTITLDLYQMNIEQSDILNFNNEIDNLTVAIKEESKEKTLNELVKVYGYILNFVKKVEDDQMKITEIETKQNIFNAYSKLDSGDWAAIGQNVQSAVDLFSKLLTDVTLSQENQYLSNKIYIMLNELKNAVDKQDLDIFLIKYEKLLEELAQI